MALNLGGREAISVYCINLPTNLAANSFVNISSTILFFSFHLCAISFFIYKIFRKPSYHKFQLLLPLTILLPTLFGTAHMRYLIPLIPLFIFFLFPIRNTAEMKFK